MRKEVRSKETSKESKGTKGQQRQSDRAEKRNQGPAYARGLEPKCETNLSDSEQRGPGMNCQIRSEAANLLTPLKTLTIDGDPVKTKPSRSRTDEI